PFAPNDRHIKTYDGAPAGMESNLLKASWDPKGERIAAGSGDRTVVVWDAGTGKLLYKLPGHKGSVNDVRFSPGSEPISTYSEVSCFLVLRQERAANSANVLQSSLARPIEIYCSESSESSHFSSGNENFMNLCALRAI